MLRASHERRQSQERGLRRHSCQMCYRNASPHYGIKRKVCRPFSKYLLQPSSKVRATPLAILIFCIEKPSLKTKNIGHITVQKHVNDVSNFLLFNFQRNEFYKAPMKPCKFQKALCRKDYLQASSIATATATVILSLRVVTCADETHYFEAPVFMS